MYLVKLTYLKLVYLKWFPLENVKTGVIHLKANFLYLSKEHQDIDKVHLNV